MRPIRAPRKKVDLNAEALWNYALRTLTSRDYSLNEIRRKLQARAAPDVVSATLDKLREYGYIDDARFAKAYATSRLENQGFGKQRILRELRLKQVGANEAEKALETTFAIVDEKQLARQYLERKFRGKPLGTLLQDEKSMASAYRRLRTAGFSSGTSVSVLKSYTNRADELAEWEQAEESSIEPE